MTCFPRWTRSIVESGELGEVDVVAGVVGDLVGVLDGPLAGLPTSLTRGNETERSSSASLLEFGVPFRGPTDRTHRETRADCPDVRAPGTALVPARHAREHGAPQPSPRQRAPETGMEASLTPRQSDDRCLSRPADPIDPANDHRWPLSAFTTCPVCGAVLPRDRSPKARRERVYCSDACRARACGGGGEAGRDSQDHRGEVAIGPESCHRPRAGTSFLPHPLAVIGATFAIRGTLR